MATIYGAQLQKSPTNENNYAYGVIGKNSEVFNANDLVTRGVTGMIVATPSDAILGVIPKDITMASDNQTVAKVEPAFVPIDQDYEFLMGTNADLDPLASPGAYYNITGLTGVQQVDVTGGVTTGADAVVVCTKVDPNGLGGTGAGSGLRTGLFKIIRVINYHGA